MPMSNTERKLLEAQIEMAKEREGKQKSGMNIRLAQKPPTHLKSNVDDEYIDWSKAPRSCRCAETAVSIMDHIRELQGMVVELKWVGHDAFRRRHQQSHRDMLHIWAEFLENDISHWGEFDCSSGPETEELKDNIVAIMNRIYNKQYYTYDFLEKELEEAWFNLNEIFMKGEYLDCK